LGHAVGVDEAEKRLPLRLFRELAREDLAKEALEGRTSSRRSGATCGSAPGRAEAVKAPSVRSRRMVERILFLLG